MEVKLGPCLCGQPEKMEADADGKPVLVRCPLYTSLKVLNEKGEWEDEWKCSIAWVPILLIENRKATDACAKYTESFRNELIARVDRSARVVAREPPTLIEVQEVQDAPEE